MQIYEVRISHGAREDMAELRKFLKAMMTMEGAIRYANNMREEIKTLAFYADLYGKTTSMTLRQIHPEADGGISILDDSLGIDWHIPTAHAILSDKDTKHPCSVTSSPHLLKPES